MNDIPIRERPRPSGPSAQITEILVSQARIETKMDNVLTVTNQVADHEGRLIKLEAFQGTILWVVNGGWAVLIGVALVLAKLGVL